MSREKSRCIREMIIDRCLSDRTQKYSVAEMMERCNAELCKEGASLVTSMNTIRADIQHINDKWSGKGGEVVQRKIGRNIHYYYANADFSIYRQGLSKEDLVNIRQLMFIFHRIQGAERFSWIEDMVLRVESQLLQEQRRDQTVGFDVKADAVGTKHLLPLFNAIVHKRVVGIEYRSFERLESRENFLAKLHVVHPYYLKEFKYRWYIIGYVEDKQSMITLALDRVKCVYEIDCPYIENTSVDFEEYFNSVIGVTVIPGLEDLDIKIWVSKKQYNYLRTSPIHPSQRLVEELDDGSKVIAIRVKENYELYQELLSYGACIRIMEPVHVAQTLKTKLKDALDQY